MKIWIDCSNSPHPLLFEPIARELASRGNEVVVTLRHHAQTVELARMRWPAAQVVDGTRVSAARAATAVELATRAWALRAWAQEARPDVALSHNSYAQIVAARSLRIRVVTAMDYEYQPMNHLAFRLADRILLPSALPQDVVQRQGAAPAKVRRYDGLKEEIYLGYFSPAADVTQSLVGERPAILAVARSGATRAAYHGGRDTLFTDVLLRLSKRSDAKVVVLARHPEHRAELQSLVAPNVVFPEHAIDALPLIREADAFIGAGGTMTREAALLGIAAWSVFAGEMPAVDRYLEQRGLLRRLQAPEDVDSLTPRVREPQAFETLRERGRELVGIFVDEALGARRER